jgi:hypothetical protein
MPTHTHNSDMATATPCQRVLQHVTPHYRPHTDTPTTMRTHTHAPSPRHLTSANHTNTDAHPKHALSLGGVEVTLWMLFPRSPTMAPCEGVTGAVSGPRPSQARFPTATPTAAATTGGRYMQHAIRVPEPVWVLLYHTLQRPPVCFRMDPLQHCHRFLLSGVCCSIRAASTHGLIAPIQGST